MLRAGFGEKCIIVPFLGTEKDRKAIKAELAETQRKKHTQKRRKKQVPRNSDDGVRGWTGNFDDSEAAPQFGF
jgi:hypothetical protein